MEQYAVNREFVVDIDSPASVISKSKCVVNRKLCNKPSATKNRLPTFVISTKKCNVKVLCS